MASKRPKTREIATEAQSAALADHAPRRLVIAEDKGVAAHLRQTGEAPKQTRSRPPALQIRRAAPEDVSEMVEIAARAQTGRPVLEAGQLRGRIARFAEGQLVATQGEAIVGFCSTFQIGEAVAFADHSWGAITGHGYAARHDARGAWLYAMETCVDPASRRDSVERRFSGACKRLAEGLGLKGVVAVRPLPGYARRRADFSSIDAYLDAVRAGEVRETEARRLLSEGFEPARLLEDYDVDRGASGGLAALMAWRNPGYDAALECAPVKRPAPEIVRVTSVQLETRPTRSVEEMLERLDYFTRTAADFGSDFVVLPELFSLAFLAGQPERVPRDQAMRRVAAMTPALVEGMSRLAVRFKINIIGGSHPTLVDDEIRNVAYACLRDGSVVRQDKLHPTPDERAAWSIAGGDRVEAFDTDCGPVAMLICYDCQFPELARRVCDQGARIIFAPYLTDGRHGHLRVKLCCQARAIENQVFVVTSGNVGNLPGVENMDVSYAQSGVYTPSDYAFARDGVAAEADPNVEMATTADLDLATLGWARSQGSVRNFRDRRFDLYKTVWNTATSPRQGAKTAD